MRRERQRVAGDAFARWASARSCGLQVGRTLSPTVFREVGLESPTYIHHDHGARIGVLKSELGSALLDGAERRAVIALELQRLVGVLDLLLLLLKARRFVPEADHLEVLPGEQQKERADGNTERKNGHQLTGAAAVAFANDVGVLGGRLLRVHAGTV